MHTMLSVLWQCAQTLNNTCMLWAFQVVSTAVLTGLTPRGITELFNILDRDSGKYTFAVSCYMLELYQDDLADLLLPASQKQQGPQKVSPS